MAFDFIGGDSSNLGSVINKINQNIGELKTQDVTKIFKDDTGVRRVLLGKGKNGFYGLKVSQEGIDVYDASDDDLVFNSSQNVFKIVGEATLTTGTVAGTATAGQVSLTVDLTALTHGLGYTPAVFGYIQEGSGNYLLGRTAWGFNADNIRYGTSDWQLYATSTQVVLETDVFASALTSASSITVNASPLTAKIFMLQETAN